MRINSKWAHFIVPVTVLLAVLFGNVTFAQEATAEPFDGGTLHIQLGSQPRVYELPQTFRVTDAWFEDHGVLTMTDGVTTLKMNPETGEFTTMDNRCQENQMILVRTTLYNGVVYYICAFTGTGLAVVNNAGRAALFVGNDADPAVFESISTFEGTVFWASESGQPHTVLPATPGEGGFQGIVFTGGEPSVSDVGRYFAVYVAKNSRSYKERATGKTTFGDTIELVGLTEPNLSMGGMVAQPDTRALVLLYENPDWSGKYYAMSLSGETTLSFSAGNHSTTIQIDNLNVLLDILARSGERYVTINADDNHIVFVAEAETGDQRIVVVDRVTFFTDE